jgi:hypothetical protein
VNAAIIRIGTHVVIVEKVPVTIVIRLARIVLINITLSYYWKIL